MQTIHRLKTWGGDKYQSLSLYMCWPCSVSWLTWRCSLWRCYWARLCEVHYHLQATETLEPDWSQHGGQHAPATEAIPEKTTHSLPPAVPPYVVLRQNRRRRACEWILYSVSLELLLCKLRKCITFNSALNIFFSWGTNNISLHA